MTRTGDLGAACRTAPAMGTPFCKGHVRGVRSFDLRTTGPSTSSRRHTETFLIQRRHPHDAHAAQRRQRPRGLRLRTSAGALHCRVPRLGPIAPADVSGRGPPGTTPLRAGWQRGCAQWLTSRGALAARVRCRGGIPACPSRPPTGPRTRSVVCRRRPGWCWRSQRCSAAGSMSPMWQGCSGAPSPPWHPLCARPWAPTCSWTAERWRSHAAEPIELSTMPSPPQSGTPWRSRWHGRCWLSDPTQRWRGCRDAPTL